MSILYVQPWDRPWTSPRFVSKQSEMFLSRAQFEVGFQVPKRFDLRILDLNLSLHEGIGIKDAIISELKIAKPELVMVSWPAFVLGDQLRKITNTIASTCPNARIVVGGSAVSLVREQPLHYWPAVTACYNGSGFEIPAMVESLYSGKNLNLPGVYTRTGKGPWSSVGSPALIDNYSAKEFYTARGRVNFQEYVARCRSAGVKPIGLIEMSRGCKFRCNYCALNLDRIGFQLRSPKTVVQEARFMAANGVTRQQLIDPTLGLEGETTLELLNGLAEVAQEFSSFSLDMLTRPEFVTDEFVQMLRRAGVWRCALGMETMDQNKLSEVKKTLKVSATRSAIQKLSDNGIEVKLFHMLFPSKFSLATIKFLSELKLQGIKFVVQSSFLRPLATPQSQTDYIKNDRTVFAPNRDSLKQLMEWMLINLTFPSMDVNPDGDPDLQKTITKTVCAEDLLELFQIKKDGREVWMSGGKHKYVYVHPPKPRAVADCLFVG